MFSSIQQNITCQIQTDLDGPAPVTIPPVQLEHGLLKSHTWWADPGLAVFDSGSWSELRRWCRRPVVLLEWPVWTEPATDTTWVRTIADFWEGFYLKCFFFTTCRSQLLWLSLRRRGNRPSPFLDLMNCFHFQAYFSNRYCFLNSALLCGFGKLSWPVEIEFINPFFKPLK